MVACLPLGRDAQTFGGSGGGAVTAIVSAGLTAGRQPEDIKAKALLQAGAVDGSISARETRDGRGCGIVGGRDLCVAVSGGLASVLELVQPLRHVGWAGRDAVVSNTAVEAKAYGKKREVLRMARVPSTWRRAAGIGECKDAKAENGHNAETVVDDFDGEAEEFMVMCEDGWLGWYQCHHRRFEVSRTRLGAKVHNA